MGRLIDALAGDPEIEQLLSDEAQVQAILAFELALAQAQRDVGMISTAAATAIKTGIANYQPDWADLETGMARDGVVVPTLVGQLRQAVGEAHAADVHKGATSQDAVDTALMLQLKQILPILLDRAARLDSLLDGLEARQGHLPLMAQTRMQAALLFTVADKLRSWRSPLENQRAALELLSSGLLAVQLGGPIGDRSTFAGQGEAIAERLAQRLGLANAAPWHTDRDRIVTLGSRLATLCGVLGKIGADIALLAQTERGAVAVSGGGTSSAMPHKANPVGAELLVALAHRTAGLSGTLQLALVHENERSGAAWTLEWLVLPDLIVATGAALRIAERLLSNISFAAAATDATRPQPPK